MHFLLKMVIFQPAMLVYQRVNTWDAVRANFLLKREPENAMLHLELKTLRKVPENCFWVATPPKINMEPKNEGLVQKIFLLKQLIFRLNQQFIFQGLGSRFLIYPPYWGVYVSPCCSSQEAWMWVSRIMTTLSKAMT